MNRWALVVGGGAAVVGIAAMWVMRPTVDPPPAAVVTPPVVTEPAPPHTPVPYEVRPDGTLGPVPREPSQPMPTFDAVRAEVRPADREGITAAALARRADIAACVERYWEQAGERGFEGRLTLEITVEGDGEPAVDTQLLNGPPDPEVESCVVRAMADAKFEATDHPVRVRWPVPIDERF